LVEINPL